eukprot:TRINITY_DN78_c0_g4_i1.p1 TRINITY_DN78_c0_g4~~TRINITY_DN78_c0_g4_i1.p1  ORF type:complete len:518 (-),score=45.40 TRINITY_DN78_c0_g4_i1:91-1644(-)
MMKRYEWNVFVHYYNLHVLYICTLSLIGAAIVTAIEDCSFVDGLFTATSASTVTGLIVLDTSALKKSTQVVVAILICLGNVVILSITPVILRIIAIKTYVKRHTAESNPLKVLLDKNRLEYKALKRILVVVLLYFFANIIFFALVLGIYGVASKWARQFLKDRHVNPAWFGVFHSISAFNDAGFSIFQDNFVGFVNTAFTPLVKIYLILSGNLAFPILLYFIIVILKRFSRKKKIYDFLLKHPRRCFTHLFPWKQTKWLIKVLFLITMSEFVMFLVLDWDQTVFFGVKSGYKITAALFQSVSTRIAGFNIVNLSIADPAMLVLYVIYMYISPYPIALSIRSSNETETKETVFYDTALEETSNAYRTDLMYQAIYLVSRDLAWLVLALLIICVAEKDKIESQGPDFSIFKIIFEIVSGYGTVGLSLGWRDSPLSLSGQFTVVSKLVVILLMIIGRHRILPHSVDRAVQLDTKQRILKTKKLKPKQSNLDIISERHSIELGDLQHQVQSYSITRDIDDS